MSIAPVTEGGVQVTKNGIAITWTDGHKSFFHANFLERHAFPTKLAESHHDHCIVHEAWTNESISESRDLFIPYDTINSPEGLVKAITQLSKYGLLFVSGVTNKETSNNACELRVLAEKFGEIRPTFYGPLWDVINVRNSRNIAYTNLDLGLHMDLLYFQHPPRYQILHCLRNRVVGGASIFVDSLHAARVLRDTHPNDFDTLTKTPVAFHYINDGHHLHHNHPTIELAPLSTLSSPSSELEISHVNYSPPFQAPLPLSTSREFYLALQRFSKLLNDPQNTYEYTLREGDAVLFDNRRVLHARTAFTDPGSEPGKKGETNRWLKGCYLEADGLVDRMRVLRTKIATGLI